MMFKKSILLPAVFAAALFTACGDESSSVFNNTEQAGCSVSENKDGSYILSCADGSEVTLHDGKDGTDGTDGQNGKDGENGADGKDGENGADGKAGEKGTDGKNGADGTNGTNGTDGTGCMVSDTTDTAGRAGYKLVCGTEFKGVVWDGVDGQNGKDGQNGTNGQDGKNGINGTNGTSCTVADTTDAAGRTGHKLVCGAELKGIVWNGVDGQDGSDGKDGTNGKDGKNGADGKNGVDGTNGTSCTVADTTDEISNRAGYKLVCGAELKGVVWDGIDGLDGRDGIDGIDGERGADGENGVDGAIGTSCTVADTTDESAGRSGYKLVCGAEFKGVVWNGIDGIKGEKGDTGVKGETGAAGTSCTVADTTDEINNRTGYKLVCGGEYKGTVWNGAAGASCTVEELSNGAGYKMLCGGDSVGVVLNANGGMCGSNTYSLTTQMCDTRDNQLYITVTIDSQTWMAQNLNYASDDSYCYNNSADNCAKYGRLYIWDAATSACPSGWHLPDSTEWNTLMTAVGGRSSAGKVLKSTTGWYSNGNGIDSFGFGVLPAGRYYDGGFSDVGKIASFWSSEVYGNKAYVGFRVYSWSFRFESEYVTHSFDNKMYGRSVRCLKDKD